MWVEAGFPPLAFWRQTERSFANALAGAAKARLSLAWQVAALTGAASVGKLKPLDDYLASLEPEQTYNDAMLLSGLFKLKASGVPMDIKKLH